MPVSAATLRVLIEQGLQGEALIAVVEAIDAEMASNSCDVTVTSQRVTSAVTGAERTRKWRESRDAQCDVTASPKKKDPTTQKKNPPLPSPPKGGSVSPPAGGLEDPSAILAEVLPEAVAAEVVIHRRAIKSPLTAGAARGLAQKFAVCPDPVDAARTMMSNGWRGFKPEWMDRQPRAGPPAVARPSAFAIAREAHAQSLDLLSRSEPPPQPDDPGNDVWARPARQRADA